MGNFVSEVRQTLVPRSGDKHGPLPPMLIAMTVVTGLVDAFSYLLLGHVFVANMTGNVVLLGFALIGARGFSTTASILAIASFSVGALIGGRVGSRFSHRRDRLLGTASSLQVVLISISLVFAIVSGTPVGTVYRYGLIGVLAVAMGIQNAAARKLAVPDLTTTVLTLTITGIAADSIFAGGSGSKSGRRLLSAVAMLSGALVGASFVVHSVIYVPLAIALLLTTAIAVTTQVFTTAGASWIDVEG
jgi:uncharacterized membrane protein YoaK (UPF0700 family)